MCDEPTVLLIDEIDRADAEFEAFLLEVLSDFQVSCRSWGHCRKAQTIRRADIQQHPRAYPKR
jgi:MoxR-like ATPase